MSNSRLIVFILIFILIGYVFYRIKPWDFTDNSKFILNILFNELDEINKKLDNNSLVNEQRKLLVARKDEIYNTLEQFFGKNLKEQEND